MAYPDLEAVSDWDGSWYDVDFQRSNSVIFCERNGKFGVKIVYRESEEDDHDVLFPEQFATCIRTSCQPVQDNECRQLQPGTKVVVLVKWPDRQDQKYYDAEIVNADFEEHGSDDGDCNCMFKVNYLYTVEPKAKQTNEFVAPIKSHIKIDDMCFPGEAATWVRWGGVRDKGSTAAQAVQEQCNCTVCKRQAFQAFQDPASGVCFTCVTQHPALAAGPGILAGLRA
eukprot:gene6775-6992_t